MADDTQLRVNEILRDLERIRERMLLLSDDVWLSIDHNDSDALEDGVKFKKEYNEKMTAFDRLSEDITNLVQAFTNTDAFELNEPQNSDTQLENEKSDKGEEEKDRNERIIKQLNTSEPYSIDEDFRYKRPYGFVIRGKASIGIVSWRKLLIELCNQLYRLDPSSYAKLENNKKFLSRRGVPQITANKNDLRLPAKIPNNFYVETNSSANAIRNIILNLLLIFNIRRDELSIYLKEDRDA